MGENGSGSRASSRVQTAAWPIYLFIIAGYYIYRSRTTEPASKNKLFCMKPQFFMPSVVIGILTGLDNYFFAYGVALLPVSTCNLILASQLDFTKLPTLLEIQLVTSVFSTSFCTIGMLINNDFKAIGRKAKEFELGETKYYMVAIFSAILWQGYFLGGIRTVFCGSSPLSGMVMAIHLPILEILAMIFFREKFETGKGLSLVLSLWGFLSYFHPDLKKIKTRKKKETPETQTKSVELPNRPKDDSSV
ncbi:Chaperone protein DNAj, putative isoform 1 [Hibiscus syriacus]|uniref:Chaperone protein DNAj, putative isoform 1 n=1 Tax=Hibiscus syriacus TaxID=106335 RepID=A0A6A2XRH8_HIBSY|nr:Chaperone protein DNAj, putative isoform 1 [Hibiscus syriacus]